MMKIPRRIASVIINSLGGGVVPRIGLPYITVGREREISALLSDLENVGEGGASFRFIVGKYGSGKSFLLQSVRNYAMDKGFVVADADLSPERRLCGTKGQGLATYRELMRNLSTKTRPESGALSLLLDRWLSEVRTSVAAEYGIADTDSREFHTLVENKIYAAVSSLREMVHGFDFAVLMKRYFIADCEADDEAKAAVLKWFRGEYQSKSDVKQALGINIMITDDNWYDYIKLFAGFFRSAGYKGLIILIDELVNLYKIPNLITRQYNYEKLLMMYNDVLQGRASGIGIIMCGTPQCVENTRRGLYSYEALRSRLAAGKFSDEKHYDIMSPIIRLAPLSYEEMLVLAEKLADIHAVCRGYEKRISEQELILFIKTEFSRVGAQTNITPREVIRDLIELLNILSSNPDTTAKELLGSGDFSFSGPYCGDNESENFAEFEI